MQQDGDSGAEKPDVGLTDADDKDQLGHQKAETQILMNRVSSALKIGQEGESDEGEEQRDDGDDATSVSDHRKLQREG